jgi:hypothetical protein
LSCSPSVIVSTKWYNAVVPPKCGKNTNGNTSHNLTSERMRHGEFFTPPC